MDKPAQSPQLNPTKHLWDKLEQWTINPSSNVRLSTWPQ